IATPEAAELAAIAAPSVVPASTSQPPTTSFGERPMTSNAQDATTSFASDDPNLVYVNGINFNTGKYAVEPRPIDEIAKRIGTRPGVETFDKTRGENPRAFALPFGMTEKLEDVGWGIVFPVNTEDAIRNALKPLIDARSQRAGRRFKEFDYKP